MKAIRAVLAAIVITAFGYVLGGLTCGWLFNWVYQLEPTNVWKPMTGPPGMGFMAAGFVLNLVFVGVYLLLSSGIPGACNCVKGLVFGLCVWAVGMLPGMLSVHYFMTVNTTVVVYWTILGLIRMPLDGVIAAAICSCGGQSCCCRQPKDSSAEGCTLP
jgi:hypothetical protein